MARAFRAPEPGSSPSTAWREVVEADEPALFEEFAREIVAQQKEIVAERKKEIVSGRQEACPLRGLHAKLHAGLTAEFQVLAGLPEYARCGVFSVPRTFPALVRFSNGDSRVNPDTNPEPRGIAIKLIGVPGRKLLPGLEDAVTQDFLATSHSVTSAVRDIRQFIAFIRAMRHGKMMMLVKLFCSRTPGPFEAWRILKTLDRTVRHSNVRSMATEEFSGTAPIKFGPYAVKFTVRPAPGTAATASRPLTDDFLREELADRLRKADLMLDFLVQFYVDDTRTPIEDTSVLWQSDDAPPLKVAQLRIPRCDLDDPQVRSQSEKVDRLSFSPWHATEDHRPLGNVMRARRVAYEESSAFRKHSPEPTALPL